MSQSNLNPVQDMATNGQIENIFSTPLFSHVLQNVDALNAELRDLILERERTTPSAAKSNIGGWQSEVDFLTWGGLGRHDAGALPSHGSGDCDREAAARGPQPQYSV